ncbi:MAG: hypothetical protein RIM99_08340 [Cyclobacteriaceae bacterium]
MDLDHIIQSLRQSFSNDSIKRAVLSDEWYLKNIDSGIDSTGFCYAACEVIYRLDGGKEKWKKMAISKNNWDHGGHCYLINKENSEILDITSDQYDLQNIPIPTNLAKGGGFRTKDFSNAARTLAQLSGLIKK